MTPDKICKALVDMLETHKYTEIKVSEFTRYAQISRSAFYFNFSSIYEALNKIEDDFIDGISDEYTAILRISEHKVDNGSYMELIDPTIKYVYKNLRLFKILSGPNGNPRFKDKLLERIKRIAKISWSQHAKMSPERMELTCELMASSQWTVYRWWADHVDEMSVKDMEEFISDYLTGLTSFF